jgi:hypothetical protein
VPRQKQSALLDPWPPPNFVWVWGSNAKNLAFVVIVSGNLATTYTNRERQRMFLSSTPMAHGSSMVDLLIASTLAARGPWQHWSLHCKWTLSESRYSIVSRSPSEKMRIWC